MKRQPAIPEPFRTRGLRSLAACFAPLLPFSCGVDCRDYDGCGRYDANAGTAGMEGGAEGGESGQGPSETGGLGAGGTAGSISGAAGAGGATDCAGVLFDGLCLDEKTGVFVAQDGDDENGGTRQAPLRTLSAALLRAANERKRVIACSGVFDENLELSADRFADIFGGFDCTDAWSPTDGRTTVRPAAGIPLRIDGVLNAVQIQRFEFEARSASSPGESSVAALITHSEEVVLWRVRLSAGNGADGLPGESPGEASEGPATQGTAATDLTGAGSVSCACGSGYTRGGGGGDGGTEGFAGAGEPGRPMLGAGDGGALYAEDEVTLADCGWGGGGKRGADGPQSESGSNAAEHGAFTAEGFWEAAKGEPGFEGACGQGGGGGRGGPSGGGGGGGCGGCGGLGGGGGQGGGGSFGLIAFASRITVAESEIETRAGGDAGKGALGDAGQTGGLGGSGAASGCSGGEGGTGAAGGAGGGGAGGLSAGILHAQSNIQYPEVTFSTGIGGAGGLPGDSDVLDDRALDGIAVDELAF